MQPTPVLRPLSTMTQARSATAPPWASRALSHSSRFCGKYSRKSTMLADDCLIASIRSRTAADPFQ